MVHNDSRRSPHQASRHLIAWCTLCRGHPPGPGKSVFIIPNSRPTQVPPKNYKGSAPTFSGITKKLPPAALPKNYPLLVFADKSTLIPTSYLRTEWTCTVKKMGVDHTLYSLHGLRKASATPPHMGGCSDLEVQCSPRLHPNRHSQSQ